MTRSNVVATDFRPHVVIVTKHKVYDLGPDAIGQSLEEVFGDAVPRSLRGAKRYMTEDGWIIGRPDPAERPANPDFLAPWQPLPVFGH